MSSLQFAPWSSDIELAFYSALASLKINHDKLDDSARKVLGLYEVRPNDPPQRSCRMQIHGNALTVDETPAGFYRAEGLIKNVNTLESFKALDKGAAQIRSAKTIWDAIHDESIYSCPSLLNSFTAVCFADLKKYKFTYHFSFPALHSDPPWTPISEEGSAEGYRKLSPQETTALVETVQTWKYSVDSRQHGFFVAKRVPRENLAQSPMSTSSEPERPDTNWVVRSLSSYESGFFKDVDARDQFICFADPSTFPGIPGWPLRNLLALIRQRWHLDSVQILCYRDTQFRRDKPQSIILNLKSMSPVNADEEPLSQSSSSKLYPPLPKISGWERNEAGRLNNRVVDLAAYMNPERLADQAVDLNLKLIKWRIAPDVELDPIKSTKCLLLGAGTLGSYVSRNLMGWGVRKITFVDNANVSYSNPVRQPLFDFKDCLGGGAKKAHRAAETLTEIYPGVDATGHVMSVPMAGHPILEEQKTKEEFEKLRELIDEHDVIFLLLDTRESRWLPTVMGKAAGKIVMNGALGFDTYVVMRHGLEPDGRGREELGCYFCNDVVAPADSLKDATLDQQCTVTRPGIAPIASALLVELLVSVLQHPLRAHAPATSTTDPVVLPSSSPDNNIDNNNDNDNENENSSPSASFMTARTTLPKLSSSLSSLSSSSPTTSNPNPKPQQPQLHHSQHSQHTHGQQQTYQHPLGAVPHQLRGFLATFSTLNITGAPFPACSACSAPVLDAYRQDPWAFTQRALNERGWVEEISGLAELQRKAQELEDQGGMEAWEEGDEDEEGEGELL